MRHFTKYPSNYVRASIRKVDSLPKVTPPKTQAGTKNYTSRIYADIKEAYEKGISTFEFVDDDYKNGGFTTYAKKAVTQFTRESIIPEIKQAIVNKFKSELSRDVTHLEAYKPLLQADGWGTLITVKGITEADGKHYYGIIDFDYPDKLKDNMIRKIKLQLGEAQYDRNHNRIMKKRAKAEE